MDFGRPVALATGLPHPARIAEDRAGDIYFTNRDTGKIMSLPRGNPAVCPGWEGFELNPSKVVTLRICENTSRGIFQIPGVDRFRFSASLILLVDRHTASAAEMIVAFARENNLARIVGENTAGRLLSDTSVEVSQGFRLALPTGAYYTWGGSVLGGTPIEPDEPGYRLEHPYLGVGRLSFG